MRKRRLPLGIGMILTPVLMLAGAVWNHVHPLHERIEHAVRTTIDRRIAPVSVSSVHCDVAGGAGTCDVSTSDHHRYRVRVIATGDRWRIDHVSQLS